MVARVQVVVDAKDSASGVLRGIASQFGQLGNVVQELTGKSVNWGNLSTQAAQFIGEQLRDSIKVTQEYAQEIRDLSAISGTGAEETSRFVQVLDDYQLTAKDAETATRKLTSQGYAPTLETVARLSDQYLALNTAQERNKFIQDNLGKSGQQWVNLLKQGSTALLEQGAAVDESLILNEQAIQNAEEYRLALDNWNDAVMGVKIAIGNELLPVLTELMSAEAAAAASEERWNQARIEGGNMSRASAGIEERHNEIVARASKEADSAARSYTAMARALASGGDAAIGAVPDLAKNLSMVEKLNQATREQIKNAAYQDLRQRLQSSGNELTQQEADLLEKAGKELGIFDQTAISTANAIDRLNTQLEEGTISIMAYTNALKNIPTTVVTNVTLSGGGGLIGTTCFVAGSLVTMADGTKKAIEKITVGEKVMTYDTDAKTLVIQKVLETFVHDAKTFYVINDMLNVTAEHLLYVNGRWMAAGNVAIGDTLMNAQGEAVVITSKSLAWQDKKVYNLHVENDPHNYFVENVLVHNAKQNDYQIGGAVYAGSPVNVGEAGRESFIPSTNGRILGHSESINALQRGGGSIGPFYGPVTLEISEGNDGGLLSLR